MSLTNKQIYDFALVFVLDKLQEAEEILKILPNNRCSKARYDKWLERRDELFDLIRKEEQAEKQKKKKKRVLIYQLKGNFTGRWFEPECYCFKDEEDEKRCIEIGNTDDTVHNIKIIEVADDVEEIDLTQYISDTDILK